MTKTYDLLHQTPLGKNSEYINQYNPELLQGIPRNVTREGLGISDGQIPFNGVDIWNAYEVSWLNLSGKPLVRTAEFRIPANSDNIIESKSLKLYLNSLNLTKFESEQAVEKRIAQDLSHVAGVDVECRLSRIEEDVVYASLQGFCLDDLDIQVTEYEPNPGLLELGMHPISETWVSHLLKSNCPVTGQPDWASIQIAYQGIAIEPHSLLAYLISYREKGDFHEHCVEAIFMDIWKLCKPEKLSVYARYLRRGGLDINPFRSNMAEMPVNSRTSRQ